MYAQYYRESLLMESSSSLNINNGNCLDTFFSVQVVGDTPFFSMMKQVNKYLLSFLILPPIFQPLDTLFRDYIYLIIQKRYSDKRIPYTPKESTLIFPHAFLIRVVKKDVPYIHDMTLFSPTKKLLKNTGLTPKGNIPEMTSALKKNDFMAQERKKRPMVIIYPVTLCAGYHGYLTCCWEPPEARVVFQHTCFLLLKIEQLTLGCC